MRRFRSSSAAIVPGRRASAQDRIHSAWPRSVPGGRIAAIDRICIGIEAAGSPFADINRHGPAVTISDFGNNIGLVIGQEIVGWQPSKLREPAVTSRINGETVGTGALSDLLSGPFAAAQFLFSLAARRATDVRPGLDFLGAVTGAHPSVRVIA